MLHLLDNYPKIEGKVITRFPPEPNGYLHLGHAKAIFTNFMFAKYNNGHCYLRLDDTNPLNEKKEYTDSIIEDVKWLGYEPYKITYTLDYYDKLYEYAKELILKNKAYVCELDREKMQKDRYDGIESPFRNRPINESLKLFEEMKDGKYKEGKMTLRLKGDMKSNNPNMRDLVAYRILKSEYIKLKYNVYPTYDYSHPIVDSLENITHSLCSMEFQTRNDLYRWIPETLGIYRPPQIEYARLNITNTVLSKRKLIELVNDNIVSGWDDPRMPTIKGLRRRGYTPEALNDFCKRIGMSIGTSAGMVNYKLLEECLRQDLDIRAPRVMAIMNPLKVKILNMKENEIITVNALDYPNLGEKSTTHPINVGDTVYIDREDFRMEDSPKYFRLAPNKIVRLKYLGLVKCIGVQSKDNNNPIEIYVELLPKDFKPEKRVQGTINWVSEIDHLNVEVRKYDHLFPEVMDDNKEWKSQLNLNSRSVMNIKTDTSIRSGKVFDKYQFERIGYFCIDLDTTNDLIVMNQTVGLKEDKNK
ncbi:glutaminyl-tRNA synthetase [Fadolivirus algeromassiliense]|jgi:glutaminyl-tRNA synthetase|uniref:glutamine--tRNA ligase n=1 Tax=Fadolivirus FV1/VV64 TaxID=3070911 RepID=A0A7D3UR56_9VIRU|nr:glutaminyl-tRNA synthetase [Fadolivirus algeromassiliense]QKF94353.1 glutaminyl-tRNA synthetase [Fadolivirus FV1/VV64]